MVLMFAFGADKAMVITFSGLLIVFSVLILLVAIIKLFGVIFSVKPKKAVEKKPIVEDALKVKTEPPIVEKSDDDEIIAVISAAVYAFGQEQNKTYSVKSIKPVKTEQKGRSAWGNAGVMQNVRPF